MNKRPIYLDFNATTPIAARVAAAMQPYLSGVFGNPSSEHGYGAEAKRALEEGRARVAASIGAASDEIVFTSGGTEANNLAIRGIAEAAAGRRHIVYSAIEHPAVTETAQALGRAGFRVTKVGVDSGGRVHPDEVAKAIENDTALVTVMLANNEVGTIQAVREIAAAAHRRGAYMHTDAAQAMGKIKIDVDQLGVDALSIAGHKFYAPKGVGALYVRAGTPIVRQTYGAAHEYGLRPGTENVMFAVALGTACSMAEELTEMHASRIRPLRDLFEEIVLDRFGGDRARFNGAAAVRLPNTSSVSFRGIQASTLLAEIGDRVAISAGAACHADSVELSAVLEAMAIPEEWAMGTVRVSLGTSTTRDEVEEAADTICSAVERMSGVSRRDAEQERPDSVVRLTRYTHGMGCACKIRQQVLEKILTGLPVRPDKNVLVDSATSDDAGVYRLSEDVALVQTTDFFTPIVDDPYAFGSIAAANALSDIYAMGAKPLFALNIVGFPSQRLPPEVLIDILRGASDKCAEAGISIIGGHTVEDTEPKFGLAVTGVVHPDRILRNSAARPGDALVLTKPLGTGIISTGVKRGLVDDDEAREVAALMQELNQAALEAMEGLAVHACTDVTGFGLLGHLHEMTAGSGVDAEVSAARVPLLKAGRRLAAAQVIPGGTIGNLGYVEPFVIFDGSISQSMKWLLADAQTSGGLLVSLPVQDAATMAKRLRGNGSSSAWMIGSITTEGPGTIRIVA